MPALALFGIGIIFSFVAWGIVKAQFIWAELHYRSHVDALRPLLTLHTFRFIGLSFLIPGVVSPDLPAAFATSAAYGDIVGAVLAMLSLAAIRSSLGIPLVWLFNIWGTFYIPTAILRQASKLWNCSRRLFPHSRVLQSSGTPPRLRMVRA
jgi:hypothetical protein